MNRRDNGGRDAASLSVVDAHIHLWDTARLRYRWLEAAPGLPRLADSNLFERACGQLETATIRGAVAIQAECDPDQASEEVEWILKQRAAGAPVAAVVAFAPVERATAAEMLGRYAENPAVRGVRRNIQDEEPGFCRRMAPGVKLLADYGLSFDICAREHQLCEVVGLVDAAPHTSFVLDHLGKPAVGSGGLRRWQAAILELSARPNVSCKLSGLGTEAPPDWSARDVAPYVTHALETFGPRRVMFGSDWPVCTAAGTYGGWLDVIRSTVPARLHQEVFNHNASEFYRLA
ncbi:MAG: amidohydrolase family protein [Acidimicrobiaceae bacterium]|nr:amidohydrolase family protein [Acidimicrobiaceae bacterium]